MKNLKWICLPAGMLLVLSMTVTSLYAHHGRGATYDMRNSSRTPPLQQTGSDAARRFVTGTLRAKWLQKSRSPHFGLAARNLGDSRR